MYNNTTLNCPCNFILPSLCMLTSIMKKRTHKPHLISEYISIDKGIDKSNFNPFLQSNFLFKISQGLH